ncbi:MAG: carbohydrate ABC transporter permease [Treponema sp.]|jgi:putative aldouronate transport system permease protein|nr:carbohydrate ABC transporter permease [Treponema sp.]
MKKTRIKGVVENFAFDGVNNLILLGLIAIMLYPMLYVVSVSLSSPVAISENRVSFYPVEFNVEGYKYIFSEKLLFSGYRNSVFYAFSSTLLMLLVTSLAAYSLALKHFILRKFFTIYLTITMFFGGGMVPTYLLIKDLGLLNTVWVMIIPTCVSAYNVFIFRTFFQQQPPELRESAFIDGANDLYIWFKIVLPLSKPLFATYGLFHIVGTWNSWFNALLYLTNENLHPIQMFLRRVVVNADLRSSYGDSMAAQMMLQGLLHPQNIQMAAIVVVMVPILCIYPFIQRYFIKGAMIGAIKG